MKKREGHSLRVSFLFLRDITCSPLKQVALGHPALKRFRLDKEELPASAVTAPGVPIVEVSKCRTLNYCNALMICSTTLCCDDPSPGSR